MFGLDAAGKTTILYQLKLGSPVTTIPTIGFNVESLDLRCCTLTLWDLGLRDKARPLIRHYMPGTDALIFVVDANDRDRLDIAAEFFKFAMSAAADDNPFMPPVLVFVNKQDLPTALTTGEVMSALGVSSLPGRPAVHPQSCCASSGDGLYEGLDWLTCTLGAGHVTGGGIRGAGAHGAPAAGTAAEPASQEADGSLPEVPAPAPPPAGVEEDEAFFAAFEAGRLPSFGAEEMLRVAYLYRSRFPEASARVCFEAAKRLGYVEHATRAYFWAARLFNVPALSPAAASSREFLASHRGLLPEGADAQEALVAEAYTQEVLANPMWAIVPLPPDRTAGGRERDSEFLDRAERAQVEEGELDPFRAIVRLGFALLRSCKRREAIKRMDGALRRSAEGWIPPSGSQTVTREYHETKQYVALQVAHLALASQPDLQESEFSVVADRCPELCGEECLRSYFSEEALASGKDAFVVPDLQPLPSVAAMPVATWHEDLDDEDFLLKLQQRALPSWGLPSLVRCAYLMLQREGRRQGLRSLLDKAAELRRQPGPPPGLFAHETLAYFTLHMVHFLCASAGWPFEQPFAGFAARCPRALDPLLYSDYYSDVLLHSREARTGLVLPDLCPLPSLVSAGPPSA